MHSAGEILLSRARHVTPAVVPGRLGANQVILTDLDHVLPVTRQNVSASKLPTQFDVQELMWGDEDQTQAVLDCARRHAAAAAAAPVPGDNADEADDLADASDAVDVIIACEVLHPRVFDLFEP